MLHRDTVVGSRKPREDAHGCAGGQQIAAESRHRTRQVMSPLGNYPRMKTISKLHSQPGDESVFADHLTLVRFFSTSSPWSNIIRSVVGANMIVKDVHRTGNTEQLRYDDTKRCQIGRAASDRAC